MLRRRAFAEIHFRYALDLRRAAPPFASIVCCGLIGCRMRRATSVKRVARGAIWAAYRLPSCVISFGDGWSCVRKEK